MTIEKEVNEWSIKDELWSGALDTFKVISENSKVNELFELLEEFYHEAIDITTINDLLWFEPEFIYEHLNIEVEE